MAPASVLNRNVQPILKRIAALTTASPQASDRFQKASPNATKVSGTSKAIETFQSVQSVVRYSLSEASISFTVELGFSGTGNQNMLVTSASRVSTIPQRLRL